MLMNELFDRYVRECIPELSPRVQRDYLSILGYLRAAFGDMAPEDIKPRHVRDFLEVKTGRIHRNRMVMILSTVFYKAIGRWCIEDDLRNPCVKVERWPSKPRTRYVTHEEFAGFRSTCNVQIQIAMDLAYLTAQRQGDIIGLQWHQIEAKGLDRDAWRILVRQGKTGKQLRIRITPAVEAVLDRAEFELSQIPSLYVIRTKYGERYTGDGFRAMWQRAMRRWERAGNARFHFHDLRAKSLSDNKDLHAAYDLSGHIDIKMTRRVYDRGVRNVEPLH